MRHEKHFPDFIFTTVLFLLLAGFFIWAFVNLMILENDPPAESLVFEECTFERYEIVNDSKTVCYFLYVEEYEKLAIERKGGFCVPSPGKYWNQYEDKYIVKKDSFAEITDFSEDGKEAFLKEYMEDWALLESDLPVN